MSSQMELLCESLRDIQIEYDVYNFSDLHKGMLKDYPALDKVAMDNYKHVVVLASNKITFWFDDAGNLASIEPSSKVL